MRFSDPALRRNIPTMKTPKIWQGVRMRRIALGADPDQPLRALTLPAAWDDAAAAALAEQGDAGLAPELVTEQER